MDNEIKIKDALDNDNHKENNSGVIEKVNKRVPIQQEIKKDIKKKENMTEIELKIIPANNEENKENVDERIDTNTKCKIIKF
jgi:hypothetical protein